MTTVLLVLIGIVLLVELWNLFRLHLLMGYVEDLAEQLRKLDEDIRG